MYSKANGSLRSAMKFLCLCLVFLSTYCVSHSQTVNITGVSDDTLCASGSFEVYGGDFLSLNGGHQLEVLIDGNPTLFGVQNNNVLMVGYSGLTPGYVTLAVMWRNILNNSIVDADQILLFVGGSGSVAYLSGVYCASPGDSTRPLMALGARYYFQVINGPGYVNPTTGAISLDPAFAGTSTLEWTAIGCDTVQGTHTFTISPSGPATFFYAPDSFCLPPIGPNSSFIPTAIPSGGTFNYNPSNLNLDLSGRIDLNASNPGSHPITYIPPNGSCSDSAITFIHLFPPNNPAISYVPNTACQNGTSSNFSNAPFTTFGGQFLYDGNKLTLLPSGAIDVNNSQTGTHTIGYAMPPPCPDTAYTTFTIFPATPAYLNYPDSTACSNSSTSTAPVYSPANGSFSAPANVIIDPSSGIISILGSAIGTHPITYTPHPDSCASPVTTQFTIFPPANASISYLPDSACQTNGSAAWTAPPTVHPLNGTFASSSATINTTTG